MDYSIRVFFEWSNWSNVQFSTIWQILYEQVEKVNGTATSLTGPKVVEEVTLAEVNEVGAVVWTGAMYIYVHVCTCIYWYGICMECIIMYVCVLKLWKCLFCISMRKFLALIAPRNSSDSHWTHSLLVTHTNTWLSMHYQQHGLWEYDSAWLCPPGAWVWALSPFGFVGKPWCFLQTCHYWVQTC